MFIIKLIFSENFIKCFKGINKKYIKFHWNFNIYNKNSKKQFYSKKKAWKDKIKKRELI